MTLPTSGFTRQLVRQAIERDAWIVVRKSAAPVWEAAVPALGAYPRLVTGSNGRRLYLSPGNLGDAGYRSILEAVRVS
ncbi:hypothetical protein [Kitasatospora sp. NPDC093558]|uniref:hypothetical protein n=1 Tax=Kitasatospora sp. NPDC093558 TaxID=3155201 RepID=UPI0034185457